MNAPTVGFCGCKACDKRTSVRPNGPIVPQLLQVHDGNGAVVAHVCPDCYTDPRKRAYVAAGQTGALPAAAKPKRADGESKSK